MNTLTRQGLRLIVATLLLALLATTGHAQTGSRTVQFAAAGVDVGINNIGSAIAYHQITWYVVGGTPGACSVEVDGSADNVTYSAGSVIGAQTCTSNGQSAVVNTVVNYIRIHLATFTSAGVIVVTWQGNSTEGGGGGGGDCPGTTTSGQILFNNSNVCGGILGSAVTTATGLVTLGSSTGGLYIGDPASSFSATAQSNIFCGFGLVRTCSSVEQGLSGALVQGLSVQTEGQNVAAGAYGIYNVYVESGFGGAGFENQFLPNVAMGNTSGIDAMDGFDDQCNSLGAGTMDDLRCINIAYQNNGSGTVNIGYGIYLNNAAGSGAMTTRYGMYIDDQTGHSTASYGIYFNTQSGAGAYGIYQTGTTTKNTLANLTISGTCTGCGTGTVTSATIAGTANQITASGTCTITTTGTCTLSLPNGVILGTDNSAAGTLQLANSAAAAHTILASGATTTNTIKGFTVAPTTGDLVSCTTVGSVCTLTDSGSAPTAFANTALSNLAAVAINTALLPGTSNSIAIGATASRWTNVFSTALNCGIPSTTSCVITGQGSTSGTATITWPAAAGTTSNPLAFSNVLSTPTGSAANNAYAFSGFANDGMFLDSNIGVAFAQGGTEAIAVNSAGPQVPSNGYYQFSSTTLGSGNSPDTAISRDSAGVVDVGTGAAGSKAGSINDTNTTSTGTVRANTSFSANGTAGISSSGVLCTATFTSVLGLVTACTAVSDPRLKVFGSYTRGLDAIMALDPIHFHYNQEGLKLASLSAEQNPEQIGFNALNVQSVMPDAVGIEKYDGVDYLTLPQGDRPIVAALVNAVKEQQAEIEALRKAVDSLEGIGSPIPAGGPATCCGGMFYNIPEVIQ